MILLMNADSFWTSLSEEILSYMGNGTAESLCIIAAVGILLLPILRLAGKLIKTDPNGFLTDRK